MQCREFNKILYQNFMYKATSNNRIMTINAVVCGFNLNMEVSRANALGFIFGPARLINTITSTVKKKESPIAIRKGISNPPFPFGYAVYSQVLFPKTAGANSLKKKQRPKPVITPATAAAPVVLFQNI